MLADYTDNNAPDSTTASPPKILGIFGLAMINIIAVDSLRSVPAGAEYGFSLVFFYLLAALFFFVPTALISAELATAWPNTGGVYIWARTAFGKQWGFLAIWLQWIYNVIWYPTILSFIAATLAYLIDPHLANNKIYMLSIILGTLWLVTGLNCLGLRVANWFNTLGALIGTLIPMAIIIGLGMLWLHAGKPTEIKFSLNSFLPDFKNFNNLAFLTTVIFGLMGLEMSAVHAGDVRNPQRDYPRALLISVVLILASLILASLAIAIVIPPLKLSVLTGLTDAYIVFFTSHKLTLFIPAIIALIILGSACGVSAWIIGPTRGLLVAARESEITGTWVKLNKNGMPRNLLILQGMIVTALCSLFVLMPSVSGAYWILSAMTSQLAVLFYIFFFAAAIKLRYKENNTPRAYRIPGGKTGIWIVGCCGIISCIFTFALGFVPPPGITIGSLTRFEVILVVGIVIFCIPPFFIHRWKTQPALPAKSLN